MLDFLLNLHWLTILIIAIALLVGGGVGAALYAAIAAYRNRKPAIAQRVETPPQFQDVLGSSCPRTEIRISDGQREYQYDNLRVVQIHLLNQGTQDFDEFKLGISLNLDDAEDGAVHVEVRSGDRDHQVKQLTPLSFAEPQPTLDVVLIPFNRQDSYSLRLLLAASEDVELSGKIGLSSPHAIRFVDLPTVKEAVQEAAMATSLSLGPFQFSFDK
ncbi:hypothetical protein NDA01_12560 [Trichocoleus desertorum AS-A10]|uniref:hypothetical protein n=1 Tax=Trichocoleus desertorum TaxID=1481672 RepID=UPI0032969D49